eukprot:TRINITY_DN11513_c0_g1_i1.p1 TRINITY_DN11513_c0_g1~~TRINITY_DN11513_c0_g1_i1.p1  ORF type:complete len:358 (-),score=11.39 TRINITY_DN11513_c0_g1_i1:4-1002(-)
MDIPLDIPEEKVCRFCHGSEVGAGLIAPCNCDGSIKYVHRSCLDSWRAASPNPQSFSTCDVCHFVYVIKQRDELARGARTKFALLIFRDLFAFILLVNIVIILLGLLVVAIDPQGIIHEYLPGFNLVNPNWSHGARIIVLAYEGGSVLFFFIIGVVGSCVSCVKFCTKRGDREQEHLQYHYYPYNNIYCGDFWFLYWISFQPYNAPHNDCAACCLCCTGCHGGHHGGLQCGNMDCGGNNDCKDAGGAILIVLLVIVVLFVLVGVVFAVIGIVLLATQLSRRHIHVLKGRKNAVIMEVVDLEKHPELRATQVIEPPAFNSPSTPLLMSKSGMV